MSDNITTELPAEVTADSTSAGYTALHPNHQNQRPALAPEISSRECIDFGHDTPSKLVRIAIPRHGKDAEEGELLKLSVVEWLVKDTFDPVAWDLGASRVRQHLNSKRPIPYIDEFEMYHTHVNAIPSPRRMLPNDTLRKLGLPTAVEDNGPSSPAVEEETELVEHPVFRLLRLNPKFGTDEWQPDMNKVWDANPKQAYIHISTNDTSTKRQTSIKTLDNIGYRSNLRPTKLDEREAAEPPQIVQPTS